MEISIVIPIYNAAAFIEENIKSIGYNKNIEIVIINDGSTDDTENLCEILIEKYPNIKYIKTDNKGVSCARNLGINVSSKDFIMFVDADDILADNWYNIIAQQKENIIKNDIIYFSEKLSETFSKTDMIEILTSYNDYNFAGPFSKIYRRNFLIENKIEFDSEIINGEDMIFNLEAINKTNKLYIIKSSFYKYKRYIGSTTTRFNEKLFESDIKFQKKIKKILNISVLSENMKNNILIYFKYNAILTLSEKISYIKKYEVARKKFEFLNDEIYKIKDNIFRLPKFSLKKKMLLLFIKLKLFFVVYYIFNLFHKNINNYNNDYIDI